MNVTEALQTWSPPRRAIAYRFPIEISFRQATLAIVLLSCLVPLIRALPENNPYLVALKVILSTIVVGVLPGTLIVMLARPLTRITIVELVGIGIAVNLGIVQLLTFLSLIAHIPVSLLALLVVLLVVAAGLAYASLPWTRRARDGTISVEPEDVVLGVLLTIVGILLYLQGSPSWEGEDLLHLSVIQRLAAVANPSLYNIYYTPDVIYTYPFPGTHFFFSMVSRIGEIDPTFVYHKMRFFWGPAVVLILAAAARTLFGRRDLAAVATLTAAALLLNGAFANVRGMFWAQLAPYSHASDVAMNVLLPALLLLALRFLDSTDKRGGAFFMLWYVCLTSMVTVVHVREIIQMLVYLGSFLLALLLLRRDQQLYLRNSVLLLGTTLLVVLVYGLWHGRTVGHVDVVVAEYKQLLLGIAAGYSPLDWLAGPFRHRSFVCCSEFFYYGWNPTLLLASPVLLLALKQRALTLLVGASIFAYICITYFPLLAIPYVYATYFEILFTPVRNIVFFFYLVAGVLLYLLAVNLARIRSTRHAVIAAIAAAVALDLVKRFWEWSQAFWMDRESLFFLPLIGLYLAAVVLYIRRPVGYWEGRLWPAIPAAKSRLTFGLLLIPLTVLGWMPDTSPVNVVGTVPIMPTPQYMFGEYFAKKFVCGRDELSGFLRAARVGDIAVEVPEGTTYCPPPPGFFEAMRRLVPADSVFAINIFNTYTAVSPYVPQQMNIWPSSGWPIAYRQIFANYFQFYDRTVTEHRRQPLFNSVESLEEKLEFLRQQKATHVLVDQMYYAEMEPVLAQWPEHFRKIYDEGQWAVYEVARS